MMFTATLSSSWWSLLLFLSSLSATVMVVSAQTICSPSTNTFTAKVDLFAGELGYFSFAECGGTQPTLGLKVGETYTFIQKDVSNWMHPLGFAYFPDGAFNDADELEPTITQTTPDSCSATFSCPHPRYMRDGQFLGVDNSEDFGLDAYEPNFFNPINDWVAEGNYSVQVTFDDTSYNKDIFYFCHIHQFMSGRIKLLDSDGNPIAATDEPALGYTYDQPSEFDKGCGSFGLNDFQLPNEFCPSKFVCGTENQNQALQDFSACIDAENCAMLHGMTTGVSAQNEAALFIHQMIPHHQNAVNMAKSLLKRTDLLTCDDYTQETNDCEMLIILREIINGQNHQIQTMRRFLEDKNYPAVDNCEVPLASESQDDDDDDDNNKTSGGAMTHAWAAAFGVSWCWSIIIMTIMRMMA